MRLLAISDPHGDYTQIPALVREAEGTGNIDCVLIAGDITNFGPDELAYDLLELLEPLGCPILAIPGNCDNRSILATLDESKAINMDCAVHVTEGVTVIGIGGSNRTPFDTTFERSEDELGAILDDLLSRIDPGRGWVVLLSHVPPKNTLDRIPGGNAGSEAIARAIGIVDLIVCGHIHEDQGEITERGTLIVNVGQAKQGQSAIITIGDEISVGFNNV